MTMLNYSTELHSPAAKLTYWNEVMREVFLSSWQVEPAVVPEQFEMRMRAISFGGLVLSNARLSQARVQNAPGRPDGNGGHPYHLYMVSRRQMVATEDRRTVLEPGDFTLADSGLASSMLTDDPYTTIGLTVPADFLREHVPNPQAVVGLRFSGSEGISRTASGMLRSMWKLAESGQLPEVGIKLAHSLLEVFAACCYISIGPLEQETSSARSHRLRIKRFIDDNLRDPELSVEGVAERFGVSSRYLQMLFAAESETASSYIRRRRLEGCRVQLADPVWSERGITEIAFGWGFNNAAHFARAFREEFGMSARDFRRRSRERTE
jgi:AraC-like DNA-binding protein